MSVRKKLKHLRRKRTSPPKFPGPLQQQTGMGGECSPTPAAQQGLRRLRNGTAQLGSQFGRKAATARGGFAGARSMERGAPRAPRARPAGSARRLRRPTRRREEGTEAPAPYLPPDSSSPRRATAEADGIARARESERLADPRRRLPGRGRDPGASPAPLPALQRLPSRRRRQPPGRPRAPAPGAFSVLPARRGPPLTFNRHDVLATDRTNWRAGAAGGRERRGRAEAGRGGAGPAVARWRGPEGSRGRGGPGEGPRAPAREPRRKWNLPGPPPPPPPARDAAPPPPAAPAEPGAGIPNRCPVRRAPAPAPETRRRRTEPVREARPTRPRGPSLRRRGVGKDAVRTMDRSPGLQEPHPVTPSDSAT